MAKIIDLKTKKVIYDEEETIKNLRKLDLHIVMQTIKMKWTHLNLIASQGDQGTLVYLTQAAQANPKNLDQILALQIKQDLDELTVTYNKLMNTLEGPKDVS